MNSTKPVQRVVDLLRESGYETLAGGLKIGSVTFDFSAVLVGSHRSSDLVIVADTVDELAGTVLRRTLLAAARALDVVASRRSMTLVIAGPRLNEIQIRELSRVCRVLLIGTPTGSEAESRIRDSLAILLPLTLPLDSQEASAPLSQVQEGLPADDAVLADDFIDAAARGPEAVRLTLRARILQAALENS